MSRWFGFVDDATVGGTTLDDLVTGGGTIPAATSFVPVTTGNVDPGETVADRNDDVRGRRGNSPSFSFSAQPSMSIGAKAYPELFRSLLRKALGGAVTSTGTAPAAIESTVEAIQDTSSNLPALVGCLVREEQVDRMTGLVVGEFAAEFPVDGEGTITSTMNGLYHQVNAAAGISPALPTPSYAGYDDVFCLRDVVAYLGDGAVAPIDCLAGFSFTVNNGLIDDAKSRFCAGKNILTTVLDGDTHKVWYPERTKLGPQAITGRLDFGSARPDIELRRILRHTDELVVELAAGPLGTTPPADEMVRLTFHSIAPTGGGASDLQREGDITSSYEFTAYIDDATNKDLTVDFVGTTAVV